MSHFIIHPVDHLSEIKRNSPKTKMQKNNIFQDPLDTPMV